jgi:hypothetical protein
MAVRLRSRISQIRETCEGRVSYSYVSSQVPLARVFMSQSVPHSDPRLAAGHADIAQGNLLRAGSDHKTNLIEVPTGPLVPGGQIVALKKVRLDIESDQVIRLVPEPARLAWMTRLLVLLLIGCLFFMIMTGVKGVQVALEREREAGVIMWSCVIGVPVLILLGMMIMPLFKPGPMTFRFDKQTNLLTVERQAGLGKQQQLIDTHSLDDAVALQLLYRFYKHYMTGLHQPGKGATYEMNLVFRNARTPRINLAVHSDWQWMRQAGPRLAEFLDVILVDQLCHG